MLSFALTLLAAGFAIWLVIDQRTAPYRRMRLGISLVVLAPHAGWRLV